MLVYFLLVVVVYVVLIWKNQFQISIAKLNELIPIWEVIFLRRVKKYGLNNSISISDYCFVFFLHWHSFCLSLYLDILQYLLVSFVISQHEIFLSNIESLELGFFNQKIKVIQQINDFNRHFFLVLLSKFLIVLAFCLSIIVFIVYDLSNGVLLGLY